jgi:glutaredoxin
MACERVKGFLSQQPGVELVVRDVDEDDAAYDELMAMGYRSVPITIIGGTVIKGFDATLLNEAVHAGA